MRRAHSQDPLIHFRISARLYTQMVTAMSDSKSIAKNIHCPTLVLQAGDDHIVSKEKTIAFYGHLSSDDKRLKIYDGWYHELLNESERSQVFAQISDWIFQHI